MLTTDWMDLARCQDHDPEAFFVRGVAASRSAIRVCERCPVKEPCLQYALENRIEFGVWGGTTERQRRRLLRRAAAASLETTPRAV